VHVPLGLVEKRGRHRKPNPEDELSGAPWWCAQMGQLAVADFLVDAATRSPRDTASEVVQVAGWLEDRFAKPAGWRRSVS